jgi:hypothetical protein
MTSPIFFDSTGNRRRLVGRVSAALLLLILIAAAIFAATVVAVPADAPLDFIREREQAAPFLTRVAHLRHHLPPVRSAALANSPERIGFYVPWDPESGAALRRHFNELDSVVAAEASIRFPSLRMPRMLAGLCWQTSRWTRRLPCARPAHRHPPRRQPGAGAGGGPHRFPQ